MHVMYACMRVCIKCVSMYMIVQVYVCAGVSPYARICAHMSHTNKTNQANNETNTNKQISPALTMPKL